MKLLLLLNEGPYGNERAYNAFRIAHQLQKDHSQIALRIFLLADAVNCAVDRQVTPKGFYNIGRMVRFSLGRGAEVKLCGSCMDARGLHTDLLIPGVQRGTMGELAQWIAECEKVINF
ncbi:MAG: DsrE family protein [Saprospiraceae bacterium]|nr:DsrE family protein [Saprospiraceae bacterium]